MSTDPEEFTKTLEAKNDLTLRSKLISPFTTQETSVKNGWCVIAFGGYAIRNFLYEQHPNTAQILAESYAENLNNLYGEWVRRMNKTIGMIYG